MFHRYWESHGYTSGSRYINNILYWRSYRGSDDLPSPQPQAYLQTCKCPPPRPPASSQPSLERPSLVPGANIRDQQRAWCRMASPRDSSGGPGQMPLKGRMQEGWVLSLLEHQTESEDPLGVDPRESVLERRHCVYKSQDEGGLERWAGQAGVLCDPGGPRQEARPHQVSQVLQHMLSPSHTQQTPDCYM